MLSVSSQCQRYCVNFDVTLISTGRGWFLIDHFLENSIFKNRMQYSRVENPDLLYNRTKQVFFYDDLSLLILDYSLSLALIFPIARPLFSLFLTAHEHLSFFQPPHLHLTSELFHGSLLPSFLRFLLLLRFLPSPYSFFLCL